MVVGSGGLSSDVLDKFPHLRRLDADGDATDFLSPSFLLVVLENFGKFSIQLSNARVGRVVSAKSVAQVDSFDGLSREAVRLKVFHSASRDVVVRSLVHDVPESLLATDGITWSLELSKLFFAFFSEAFPVGFIEVDETSSGVVERLVLVDGKTDADREVVVGQLSRDGPLAMVAMSLIAREMSGEVSGPFTGERLGISSFNITQSESMISSAMSSPRVSVSSCVPELVVGVYVSKKQSSLESGQVLKGRFVPGVA